jgi:small subunit ribosomal protein S18
MANPKRDRRAKPADPRKPKRNLLASLGVSHVDYKDTSTLRLFLSERGKIRSRNVTGLTVQQQREVATAIKNAREMALLPPAGPVRTP